ncbi:MAG: asparagine--tRNA ligase [Acidobacteriota bacterium]
MSESHESPAVPTEDTPADEAAAQDEAASAPESVSVRRLAQHDGEAVKVSGWLDNKRRSGKIAFLQVRDGSGVVQAVAVKSKISESAWQACLDLTQESSLEVEGIAKLDERAPGGVELQVTDVRAVHVTEEYPITPKEHGTAFLMEHRHLWLRSSRQRAALAVRSEVCHAIRDFYYQRDFTLIDSPILTPAACEGTSTLFETDYFGDPAYLSQSGQLYLEPALAAFGKVYCFGPTFRAEKSKTRRHLMEFWMVEPEVAYMDFDGIVQLAEDFLSYLVGRVLDRCEEPLKVLERDTSVLEASARGGYPRIRYSEAVEILKKEGQEFEYGDDFGAEHETILASQHDRPLVITHFPMAIKAFYMQPDAEDESLALGLDIIAPEGYGEIVGGSERIHDHDLLLSRIQQHELPLEAFQWYLDVRKYGSVPHSGFGMGLERFVAWMCKVPHLRETIPYPRMLHKIYP